MPSNVLAEIAQIYNSYIPKFPMVVPLKFGDG